jgi:septation ring formation regulator EzrA
VLEGIQQLTDSRRHVLHIALELLETEYKDRLTEEHMDMAYDFLENEAKAVFFTGIKDGEARDRWLERKAGVVIISAWVPSD